MNAHIKLTRILIGMTLLPSVGNLTLAQEGLVIRCFLEQSRVVLGEPVRLGVELRNEARQPLTLYSEPDIYVSRDGQQFFKYDPSGEVVNGQILRETNCRWTPWKTLRPGEVINVPIVLSAWLDNVFGAPAEMAHCALPFVGEYVMYASYGSRRSELVKLRVEAPEGKEAVVWRAVPASSFARLIQNPAVQLTSEERQTLERVVKLHRDSVYTHHLALALGRYNQRRAYQIPLGGGDGERARYLQRAREYFELAARMEQVPWVREEALLELAKLKGGAEAIRICDEALQRWPESFLREEFLRLRAAWQKELELEAMFKPTEDGGLRAERELKAMGYDLDNLTEAERRILAYEIERGTWEECEQRQLSNEECDELLYRRYMDWVMKNLRPVRPAQTDEVGGVTVPLE